jgi:hypothetical protein
LGTWMGRGGAVQWVAATDLLSLPECPTIAFRSSWRRTKMTSPLSSTDLLKSDLDDQQVWKACIGLDLADRTVLESEVLTWRIVSKSLR